MARFYRQREGPQSAHTLSEQSDPVAMISKNVAKRLGLNARSSIGKSESHRYVSLNFPLRPGRPLLPVDVAATFLYSYQDRTWK